MRYLIVTEVVSHDFLIQLGAGVYKIQIQFSGFYSTQRFPRNASMLLSHFYLQATGFLMETNKNNKKPPNPAMWMHCCEKNK